MTAWVAAAAPRRSQHRPPRAVAPTGSRAWRRHRAKGANALQDLRIADLHVLADQVRGHLAAHACEGGDEGRADLAAQQARGLHRGAEGQRILRPQMQDREEHHARERKALAHGLQQLRGQELVRYPRWA